MNRKVSLLMITILLTVIVFGISTYLQKQLVDYVPTVTCMVMKQAKEAGEMVTEKDIQWVEMPISIISSVRPVQAMEEIQELYLKDKIYRGQILLTEQFDTKENLRIYQAEEGKEKIAIKVKEGENGVSYTIHENSIIQVYATLRREYVSDIFAGKSIQTIGSEENGYAIIPVLQQVKVLGVFQSDGEPIEDGMSRDFDTILVAVTPEEATQINLIREVATFHITELGKMPLLEEEERL